MPVSQCLSQCLCLPLKVELSPVLSSLGGKADTCGRELKALVNPPAFTSSTTSSLDSPSEPALAAFLLALAIAELSRAALAPLPTASGGGEGNGVCASPATSLALSTSCPLAVPLAYLQGVLPEGQATKWAVAIAERACVLYVARLRCVPLA